MTKQLYLLILSLLPILSYAQKEKFTINNHEFSISAEVVDNEWDTKDTINRLYRIENGELRPILKYYIYKDGGGDCNNLFWDKETMNVNGDSLIFTTHYFQETGIDPIPEWRKQIYQVNSEGELILIYDRYKYYNFDEWVTD